MIDALWIMFEHDGKFGIGCENFEITKVKRASLLIHVCLELL